MKILLDGTKSSHRKRKTWWTWKCTKRNYTNEAEKNKHIKKEQTSSDLWEYIEGSNLPSVGVPENMGLERISEQLMAEKFPKLMSSLHPQI